jgi:hypothetical protein
VKIIRRGVTRTVILTRRHAIKVPSLRGASTGGVRGRLCSLAAGIQANESEYTWHTYEPWAGQVAPVLRSWLGGIVQVYPRCEPLAEDVADAALPVLDPEPGDRKADNFGLLDGRIVRLDYAMH